MVQTITFIQTGGTIYKDYPRTTKGYAFEISSPAIKRIMEKVNPAFEYDVIPLLQKDSLDITEDDRGNIFEACKTVSGDKIVITHGTDTMIETAKKLSSIKGKTIVITGAMRPEKFSDSDAMFNVGAAVTAAEILPDGIYIAMHGRVYEWDKVTRDMENGQFVGK